VNSTADVYRMNPAEDTLVYGDQLAEGMWVLPSSPTTRFLGEDEDSRLRAQRFRRVTRLRREPFRFDGEVSEVTVFVGEWVDGYMEEHRHAVGTPWIVKKAPADPEAAAEARNVAGMCRSGYARHAESAAALGLSPAPEPGLVFEVPDGGAFTITRGGKSYTVTVTLADLPAEGEGGS
jgi:hypothetical protein